MHSKEFPTGVNTDVKYDVNNKVRMCSWETPRETRWQERQSAIMAELNSSLTAMDWLPKLSVGTAMSGTCPRNINNNNEPGKDKAGMRKAPNSPLDPNAVLDEDEARQHKTRENKPPYSYANMITFAINSSPKKKMTLSDIYQWICDNFPYYKDAGNGWKVRLREQHASRAMSRTRLLMAVSFLDRTQFGIIYR